MEIRLSSAGRVSGAFRVDARTPATAGLALMCLAGLVLSCGCFHRSDREVTQLKFWGLGREGEVVAEMVPEFERRNPGIRVDVQQIPWTAAHEKLLTAHVGESLPDVAQMGNTWIPEFHAAGALEDLTPFVSGSSDVGRENYFEGIWNTNLIGPRVYGVPWYVDTRVLFYRSDILRDAGFAQPPRTWSEWREACRRMKEQSGRSDFDPMLLPTNEWPPLVALAVQQGAPLVADDATALFHDPRFTSALEFYLGFFRSGFAPVVSGSQIANLYQQFGDGEFAMFITGPWNVGELRRRLPPEMQDRWTTAPLPAPDGKPYPGESIAGGSSLVLFHSSTKHDAAWRFIEFLSEPEQQVRLYELSGDLPARKAAWNAPILASDTKIAAFRVQLDHTVALPRIPEWEHIATTIFEHGELAARGQFGAAEAGRRLDAKVNEMLSKRRWVVSR